MIKISPRFLVFFISLMLFQSSYSITRTWDTAANNQLWNQDSNWDPATGYPDGTNFDAVFSNIITNNRNVQITTGVTVASIEFDDNNRYTIQQNAGGQITMDTVSGNAAITVNTSFGTARHEIQTSTVLAENLTFTQNNTNNHFRYTGTISSSGSFGITKEGNGQLRFGQNNGSANTYTGDTIVNAGNLFLNKPNNVAAIPANTSVTVNGGQLRLRRNNMFGSGVDLTLTGGTFNMDNRIVILDSLTITGGNFNNTNNDITLTNSTGTALSIINNTIVGDIFITGGSNGNVAFTGASGTATLSGAFDLGAVVRTFNIANGSAAIDMNLSGIISGTGGITKTGAGTLEFSVGGSNTYTGLTTVTAGTLNLNAGGNSIAGDITINGGTLQLQSADQIVNTSDVTLSSGTFDFNSLAETFNSFTISGGTVSNPATITLTDSESTLNISSAITIGGTVSFTGATSVNPLIEVTTAVAPTLNNINLGSADRVIDVDDASGTLTIAGVISESAQADITKEGSGILTLSGTSANTFTGDVIIDTGIVLLNKTSGNAVNGDITINAATFLGIFASNQIADSSTVDVVGGNFVMLNAASETIAALNVSSNGTILMLNAGTSTITSTTVTTTGTSTFAVNNASGILDFPNPISGTGGITKINAGTVNFSTSSANTFGGLASVTGGTLNLNGSAITIPGNVTVSSSGTLQVSTSNQIANTSTVTINGGTLILANAISDSVSILDATGAATFSKTDATSATITALTSASISGTTALSVTNASGNFILAADVSGVGSFTKTGAGTFTFGDGSGLDNSYTGDTTVSAGILALNKPSGVDAIPASTTVNITGGTLRLLAANQIDNTADVDLSSGTFDLNSVNDTINSLSVSGGSVTNVSTLNLNDMEDALVLASTISIGGTIGLTGPTSANGVISAQNANAYSLNNLALGTVLRVVDVTNASGSLGIAGVISGSGALTKQGPGTLTFSGGMANSYTGLTTVTTGVLQLNKSGVNAIVGDILVNGGTLALQASNQIADTSDVSISSGMINFNSNSDTINSLTLSGGTLLNLSMLDLNASSSALVVSVADSIGGSVNLLGGASASTVIDVQGAISFSLAALDLRDQTRVIEVDNASGALIITGVISETSGTGGITKTGPGILDLNGSASNTYTGITTATTGTITLDNSAGNSIPADLTINGGTVQLLAANQIANTSDVTLSSGTFDLNSLNETVNTLTISGGSVSNVSTLSLNDNTLALDVSTPITIGGTIHLTGTFSASNTVRVTGANTVNLNNVNLDAQVRTLNVSNGSGVLDIGGLISGSGGITKTGAGALEFSGGSSNTYTGQTTVTSGTLDLNMSSGTALVGSLLINGGTVFLQGTNQLPTTSDITMSSGTFDLNNNAETFSSLTISGGTLSNVNTLTLTSASAALNLSTNIAIGGQILLSGGASASSVIDVTGAVTASLAALDLGTQTRVIDVDNGSGTLTITGLITQSGATGAITKTGLGTLTLNGSATNTFAGTTTVTAGTLELNNTAGFAIAGNALVNGGTLEYLAANQISTTSDVSISSGTIDFGSFAASINSLTVSGGALSNVGNLTLNDNEAALNLSVGASFGGTITLAGGASANSVIDVTNAVSASITNLVLGAQTRVIDVDNASGTLTASGVISGTGAVTKAGSGTLTYSGTSANTHTGNTTVSSGTLNLNKTAVNAIVGDVFVTGGTLFLSQAGQIATTSDATLSSGSIDFNSQTTSLNSFTMSGGTVSNITTLSLAATEAALNLSSSVSLGGQINLIGGASANSIIDVTGVSTTSITNLGLGSADRVIDVDNASGTLTISGVVSEMAMSDITKTGSGSLTFSGSSANTFTGDLIINGGDVTLNKSSGNAILGDVTINASTMLDIDASNQIADTSTVTIADGTLRFQNGSSETVATLNATGAATIQMFDTGTSTLTGTTASIGGATAINVDSGSGTFIVSAPIAGAGSITKTGAGTATYSGSSANTYTGDTTVSAGTLNLDKTGVEAIAGDVFVSGGTLFLSQAGQIATTSDATLSSGTFNFNSQTTSLNSFTMSGGTVSNITTLNLAADEAALNLSSSVTLGGQINLIGAFSANAIIDVTGVSITSITNLALGSADRVIDVDNASGSLTISGVISETAMSDITKTGSGNLTLSGSSANTFTGDLIINGGDVTLNKSSGNAILGDVTINASTMLDIDASNQIADTSTVTIADGTLRFQNGSSETVATLNATGAATIQMFDTGTSTLTGTTASIGGATAINVDSGSGTFIVSAPIAGAGSITKTGAGTATYSGSSANTYTGDTTVSAGTLNLDKTSVEAIAGDVFVSGGTLFLSQAGQIATTSDATLSSGTFNFNSQTTSLNSFTMSGGTVSNITTLNLAADEAALNLSLSVSIGGQINLTGGASLNSVIDVTGVSTTSITNLGLGSQDRVIDVDNASGTLTISGIISETATSGITTAGSGTITFSGSSSNSYTGDTTIPTGTLQLNKSSGSAIIGDITINGGTLALLGPDQIANTSDVTLSSGVFDFNSNTDTINSLTISGGTILNLSSLELNASSAALNVSVSESIGGQVSLLGGASASPIIDVMGAVTLSLTALDLGDQTRVFDVDNGSGALIITGLISETGGTGGITKTGPGILDLNGSTSNTYTGITTATAGTITLDNSAGNSIPADLTINGGTVQLLAANQIATSSDVEISSGTLDLNNFAETFNSLTVSGGSVSTANPLNLQKNELALDISGAVTLSGQYNLIGGSTSNAILRLTNAVSASIGNLSIGSSNREIEVSNASGELTISEVLSGNGDITKIGSGKLTLAGSSSNTFTGDMIVQVGSLDLNKSSGSAIIQDLMVTGGAVTLLAANQLATTSDVSITSGSIDFGSNNESINSLTISGGTISNLGILTLNAFENALVFNVTDSLSGEVRFVGASSLNPTIVINNAISPTLTTVDLGSEVRGIDIANGSGTLEISGEIKGSGGITVTGSGELTFSGTTGNTYTGDTTVSTGTLILNKTTGDAIAGDLLISSSGLVRLDSSDQISNSSSITINGGELRLTSSVTDTIGSLITTNTSEIRKNNTGASVLTFTSSSTTGITTLNVVNAGGSLELSGAISGSGGFITSGSGNVILSGAANSFSGLFTIPTGTVTLNGTAPSLSGDALINGGTLDILAVNQLGTGSDVTISSGTIDFNSNAQAFNSLTIDGGTLSNPATITLGASEDALIFNTGISLAGLVNFNGVASSNATIEVNGAISPTLGNVGLGSQIRVVDVQDGSGLLDITGVVNGTGGITKLGLGSLTLSGSSGNTYSGDTTVSGGILNLSKSSGFAIFGDTTIDTTGTVVLTASNQFNTSSTVTIDGGSLQLQSGVSDVIATLDVSNGASIQKLGATTETLTYTSGTASDTTTIQVSNGSGMLNLTGAMTGTGGFSKTGSGTLIYLGAGNTYSGDTTVNAGELHLNKSSGVAINGDAFIPSGTLKLLANDQIADSSLVTLSGGTYDMNTFSDTIDSFTFTSGTFNQGGATLTLNNSTAAALTITDQTISGPISLTGASNGNVVFDNSNNGTATLSGGINIGNTNRDFNIGNGTNFVDMEVSSVIAGTGASAAITKTGLGTLRFSGSSGNTYLGNTTVNGGSLLLNKTTGNAISGDMVVISGAVTMEAIDQFANTSNVTVQGGTLNLGGFSETINSLTFTSGSFPQTGGVLTLQNTGLALSLEGNQTLSDRIDFTGALSASASIMLNMGVSTIGRVDLGDQIRTINVMMGSDQLTMNGEISETGGTSGIIKTGSGILTFSGNSSNTYTGLTTIATGTLELNKSGAIAIPANALISGGTLKFLGTSQATTSANININGGILNLNGNSETIGSLTFTTGTLLTSGSETLTLASTGTALETFAATPSITVPLFLTGASGGKVLINSTPGQSIQNIDLGNVTREFEVMGGATSILNIVGIVSETSASGITKTGTGTLEFSGTLSNTFTGTSSIDSGVVFLSKSSNIQSMGGDININGGTVTLNNSNQIANSSAISLISGAFNLNSNNETISSLTITGGSVSSVSILTLEKPQDALVISTSIAIPGEISLTGSLSTNPVIKVNSSSTSSMNALNLGNVSRGISATAGSELSITGVIAGSSTSGINKTGTGTLILSGGTSNTYSGSTLVTQGTLQLGKTSGDAIVGNAFVQGGTLLLDAPNQISTSSMVTLNSGIFDLDGNTDIISSLVFNGGTLSQSGATLSLASTSNALVLVGNRTISGPIKLSSLPTTSTLVSQSSGSSSMAQLDLTSGIRTIEVIGSSSEIDISADIIESSTAGITKIGTGTLVYSGSIGNSYTGLTTVTAGTLELNKLVSPALAGDLFVNGGTVTVFNPPLLLSPILATQFSGTNVQIDSGIIDFSNVTSETIESLVFNGGQVLLGSAELNISGTSNALTMRNTALSGMVNLTGLSGGGIVFDTTNNGTAIIDDIDLGSISRTISIPNGLAQIDMEIVDGIGFGFNKTGTGLLAITGTHIYTGDVFLNQGTLRLDGIMSCNKLTVESGALLQGTGVISASETRIEGIIRPGDSIGTLTLSGAVTFVEGSTVEIEFSPTETDLIDVIGTLELEDNITLKIFPEVAEYIQGFSTTIIQTTGGLTGTFATVESSYPLFTGDVVYTANNVILEVAFLPLIDILPSGNARAVAECIDQFGPDTEGTDFFDIFLQLVFVPSQELLVDALDKMQPSMLKGLALSQENNALQVATKITDRLHAMQLSSCEQINDTSKVRFWADGFLDSYNQATIDNQVQFYTKTAGANLGLEYLASQSALMGVSGAYTYSDVNFRQERGNGDINSAYLALYLSCKKHRVFFNGILQGGFSHYNEKRNLDFLQVNRKTQANFNGGMFLGHMDLGFQIRNKAIDLAPFLSLDYIGMYQQGFTESGAESLNLKVNSTNYSMLRSQAGLHMTRCIGKRKASVLIDAKLALIEEERFGGDKYTSSFIGTDCEFTTNGMAPDRFLFAPSLGLSYSSNDGRKTVGVNYNAEIGGHSTEQDLSFQGSIRF